MHYVEDRVEKARSEGFNCGQKRGKPGGDKISEFILDIGKLPGIGQATMEKIRGLAQEGGYIK